VLAEEFLAERIGVRDAVQAWEGRDPPAGRASDTPEVEFTQSIRIFRLLLVCSSRGSRKASMCSRNPEGKELNQRGQVQRRVVPMPGS
jgi:hypothetical protein